MKNREKPLEGFFAFTRTRTREYTLLNVKSKTDECARARGKIEKSSPKCIIQNDNVNGQLESKSLPYQQLPQYTEIADSLANV